MTGEEDGQKGIDRVPGHTVDDRRGYRGAWGGAERPSPRPAAPLPAMLTRYEQAAGMAHLKHIVVDRESMSAEFLAALTGEG
ncbi:hypothetical protein KSC_109200 [Ktedonobacter sp. SOSP1-52]|uniref:hypothetical protein n=1 Tax=Ktedonobacter sp. SOSP1-52 TaxID=2778366 RepID=UPI0019158771|nr:hypothetical protein [Ktedonobacter sp. SOSP1-52]GHO72028.1 hypothetical protein KSC_109200 [Ktedonobacter sp. SOSP1-52]